MIKFTSIPCIVLALLIGCRTVDGETNMVLIPAGEFQMGNKGPFEMHGPQEDESPLHTVYVDAFYMDKYEVTNADYKKFIDANPEWQKSNKFRDDETYLGFWNGNNYPEGQGNHPVNVNWYAAMAYAKWAEKRLPTEAEWEKAARGGLENKVYPWGNSRPTTNLANYEVNPSSVTVGLYPPNDYGLYDMAGNVWEWCLDEYQADFYQNSPNRNPIAGVGSIADIIKNHKDVKSLRVLRGGGWVFGPDQLRVSKRYNQPPEQSSSFIGFRCIKSAKP